MRANFGPALTAVLHHEGGFVHHRLDPGGATNRGVTQAVYDDWREDHGFDKQSVKDISSAEVMAIYKTRYWDPVRGDDLPAGVDYCVFDFAVNSGVNRASRYLQDAAGVNADGKIGPITLAAVNKLKGSFLIDAICHNRMTFLKQLSTFDAFGRGWTRRVEDVRAKAKEMAPC